MSGQCPTCGSVLGFGASIPLAAQPRAVPGAKAMAYRFMGWRLPDDFRPDCGISFDPESLKHWPGIWPVGTNLFTADQAEQMFRYVLDAAPSPGESNNKPTDCSGDPSSCPDNEGCGCYCSDLRREGESA